MTNHFSNKFYFKVLKRALLREFLGRGQIKRDTHLVREGYVKRNLAAPPVAILKKLTGLTEWEILSRIRAADIDFTEGSILEIPFPKNSFDAVFSNSVIEQIPRDYMKVFTGVFRVAEKIAFFSEPEESAQRGHIFNLMHLKNIDYFCASYREVEKAGFKTLSFEIPPLQKFVFNTGLLVVSKI